MVFTQRRLPWLLLASSALILEGAALYFQYGLELDPCVLCIYQRAAVLGIFLSALIGMSAPRSLVARSIGYAGWALAAGWCLYLALELSGMQLGMVQPSLSCDVNAKFPAWLKLDHWLPAVFQPTGFCGDIQWQFLGLSMPLWLALIMLLQLIVLGVVLSIELRWKRGGFGSA
ncbi:MAG: disulfide bond formation protein DsbB [gamma proteobacterium symbiont of Ctena orbiculata]|nr:MAG: disulfide bond formation protein DsbB [gamma proteobacterium symbiont of Ctena orbiculata]PUB77638.1 MAG: disulfide bond formation protein DsbB [gamma proteobacterium symbiont of Ctena orbiculata]